MSAISRLRTTDSTTRTRLALGAVCLAALAARLYFAAQLAHPGHGDPAFYFSIVQGIVAGRGLEIDYIWHYLTAPAALTHPGADYWMVFAAVLMSVPYALFGSLFSVLVLSCLFGVGIAILTFIIAGKPGLPRFAAWLACLYLLFEPALFDFSISADAPVYYVFFVMLALSLMIKGHDDPKLFVWAGAASGLAHLTRQDALLLVPTLSLVVFLFPAPLKARLRWLGLGLAAYLLVISPMLFYNLRHFGALLPPGPARVAFALNHEDVYVYTRELSLDAYLALGWAAILKQKALTGFANLEIILARLGLFVTLLAGVAFVEPLLSRGQRPLWRRHFPVLLFFGLEYLFYTLAASVVSTHGSFGKAVLTVLPFIVLFACDALARHVPNKPVALLLAAFFIFPPVLDTFPNAQGKLAFHAEIDAEMTALADTLQTEIDPFEAGEIIIMTRDPWEVYLSTGYRTLMIPFEELDVIYAAARRYGANYLLLPAPSRPALDDFRAIAAADARFEFAVQVPGTNLKLYRILHDAP
jgi:hypothetical protein